MISNYGVAGTSDSAPSLLLAVRPLVVFALSVATAAGAYAQAPPLSVPLHDPAYTVLEGLENSGCVAARVSVHRPYTLPAIQAALRAAASDPRCSPLLLTAITERFGTGDPVDSVRIPTTLEEAPAIVDSPRRAYVGGAATVRVTSLGSGEFRPLWDDLRAKEEGDAPVVGLLRVRGRWSPVARTVAVVEGYAQSHGRNDPFVRARSLRSTSGVVGISEATLSGVMGPVTLSFGRDREAWLGRGFESLVLSAHGPPLDRLALSFVTDHFEGRAIYGMLDDVVLDTLRGELPSGTPGQRFHRTLIAHSLTWRPSRRFEATAGETVLLSRGSRTLDLGYANPLMPFIVTQNDAGREGSETRDNIAAFVAVRGRLGSGQVTAELLIDDIQIDAGDRELTPDQLGWRVEARQGWTGGIPGALAVEYERLNTFTYLRGYYTDVYQFVDRPLGSELGPDADRIQGMAELWVGPRLRMSSRLGVWRRGARRIDDRPAEGAVGNAGQLFPSTSAARPAVQRALLGDIMAELVDWRFPLVARVEAARIENPGHATSGSATYLRAHLSATYAFRYP